ncbi:G-protein coupled receptor 83-like [Montipora foliosa]|uniref:G-protein coupled receptor 83-like n=1 Tax=Montipora foliosa TaxID=591990 RepID=UPI0035F1F46B
MGTVINQSTPTGSRINQSEIFSGQENNQPSTFTEQRGILSENALEVAFSVIAGSAFMLNFMFCLVLVKKREMLRKPHNTLLFNLAITDLLTGILLVFTPGYVSIEPLFPLSSGLGGHMFCTLLANRYLLFTVAKVSLLLVTCLAVERWYCVMRPIKYKVQFDRKHLLTYIVFSWVTTCALQSHKFFENKLDDKECVAVDGPYGQEGVHAFVAINSFSIFVIPCVLTWLTFAHIRCHAISVVNDSATNTRREKQQKMVLRMCAITAVLITLCWFPAQLSYSLTPFGITRVDSAFHRACKVLAFCNSCINPLVYWYYHREYRKELIHLLSGWKLICIKHEIVENRENPNVTGPGYTVASSSHLGTVPTNSKGGERYKNKCIWD